MRRSLIPATGLAAAGLVVLTLTPATAAAPAASHRGAGTPARGPASAVGAVATRAVTAATGDSRTVREPVRPATCAALPARLTASNRKFTSAQEASPPDTDRVQ